jgi:hypothetical protein
MTILNKDYAVTVPHRTLTLAMIDQDSTALASTEAAIALALESIPISRSEVERAKRVFDEVANIDHLLTENLETMMTNAKCIRESIAWKRAMLSAVRLLPAEVIEEIALIARDSLLFSGDPKSIPPYPTEFMIGLLSICTRWRTALGTAPRLWQILPMRPSRQASIDLVARLRPLVRKSPVHWWLHVRSSDEKFDEDMEAFQRTLTGCGFEETQFTSLTLVFDTDGKYLRLCLSVSTVTTLVLGTIHRPTGGPSSRSRHAPHVRLQPKALPALQSLELRGAVLELEADILPDLRTFIVHGIPINEYRVVGNVLERCPKLSKLTVDHCIYHGNIHCVPALLPNDSPKLCLAITELALDLMGVDTVLQLLADANSVFEFSKPIEKLMLTNHLCRIPSPALGGYMPGSWEGTSVEYDAIRVRRILRKLNGVQQLYFRIGGDVIPQNVVPFTFKFQTPDLAPLTEVEELVLECASGCADDEVRVTLEGLYRDLKLFPRLRAIRIESCKAMTSVWEPLVQIVRARMCLERVEFLECSITPGACPELDDLLASRRV